MAHGEPETVPLLSGVATAVRNESGTSSIPLRWPTTADRHFASSTGRSAAIAATAASSVTEWVTATTSELAPSCHTASTSPALPPGSRPSRTFRVATSLVVHIAASIASSGGS